ncbi:hypothetical protein [Nakamurella lactea]|uniref:hypothetical protein n=1 Tax=Nakamurella lactea TaxID=459515 RepID=UPI0003F9D3D3|nr:hypothetical protein [Nakamurella lactea]
MAHLTHVDYIDGETGQTFQEPGPARAQVRHMAIRDGDDFAQVIPPDGFDPLRADDTELLNFGISPRPTDQSMLADWTETMGRFKAAPPISMCESQKSHSVHLSNWAGVAVTGVSDYRRVAGSARIPHITRTSCGSGSPGESRWVGIGGYGTSRLIQNGASSYSNGTYQVMQGWWEMLNSGYDTHEMDLVNNPYNEGDLVRFDTYYNSATNKAIFNWTSSATGEVATVTFTSIDGHTADQFYDGRAAEWIDERPTGWLGQLYWLENFGTAGWGSNRVYRAGQPATYLTAHPYDIIDMYSSHELAGVAGAKVAANGDFSDKWLACN